MSSILLTIAVLLMTSITIVSRNLEGKENISYQIHSNNDLREFKQNLLKGARRFKFDPFYISKHPLCGEKSCFILTHDEPLQSVTTYNTSDDLLTYLNGDEMKSLSKLDHVTIALCFKDAPDFCREESSFWRDWLDLVDDFHKRAITSLPLNIEIILDGQASPVDCLVGKWQPWKSVWVNNRSPSEAFYSNDFELGYNRFQVLNNPEDIENWQWMASEEVNYGKFSNSSSPYQLWEPDSEEDIQTYMGIYNSGRKHRPGFHFAINTDIAMFEVFSSKGYASTQRSVSISEAGVDSSDLKNVISNPRIVKVPPSKLLLFWNSGKSNHIFVTWLDYTFDAGADTVTVALTDAKSSALALGISDNLALASLVLLDGRLATGEMSVKVLLITSRGEFYLVEISGEATVTLLQGGFPSYKSSASVSVDACDDTKRSCFAIAGVTDDNHVYIQIIVVSDFVENFSAIAPIQPPVGLDSTSIITDVSLEIIDETSLFLSIASAGVVYGCEVSMYANSSTEEMLWVKLTVGSRISTSTTPSGALVMVTSDGYCFNSHEHNTRATVSICSSIPESTPGVLQYSIGLVEDWRSVLRTNSYGSFALSACSSRILHGVYDQGRNPTVALIDLQLGKLVDEDIPRVVFLGKNVPHTCHNVTQTFTPNLS